MNVPDDHITLAFYKDGKSVVSKFIRWITQSEHYSHVEIIFGTVWVSALIGKGVVSRRYIPKDHREKYTFITVPIDKAYWHDTIKWINHEETHKMYDFLGATFGNILHIPIVQDPNKWFCSELVSAILEKLHEPRIGDRGTSRMTPQKLYNLYKEK